MWRHVPLLLAILGAGCGSDDSADDAPGEADGGADGDADADGAGDADADGDADTDGDAVADDGGPPPVSDCVRPPVAAGDPELPRVTIETAYVPPGGAVTAVPAGGDLQAALDAAAPGDQLVLEAGAVYRGNFRLPAKTGDDWIVIRTGALDALPAEHVRVGPADAAAMPTLETPSDLSVVTTADGAHHYRFIGIQFRPAAGQNVNDLIVLGSASATDVAQLAHHIVIDRCLVRGDPAVGGKRGVQLNAAWVAVVDSWIADWKRVGQDTQALLGWNGPGPFKIVNNYLEGAGENVMFGGADAAIVDLIPSDIEICGNHFAKPTAWQEGRPEYEGTHWSVKNLFELKVGRRVLVSGNLFERCWADAQVGFAVVLKSANQDGGQPWAVTEHVTFAYNVVRDSNDGINVSRSDGGSLGTNHVRFYGNLLYRIGGDEWGGEGRLFQVLDGVVAAAFDHNTGFARNQCVVFDGAPMVGFDFRNNLCGPTTYGVFGSGQGEGTGALAFYAPDGTFSHNVIVGATEAAYPAGNHFPATLADVGFTDAAAENFRLLATSPYAAAAADGTAIGADFDALAAAQAGAE
jgi:hypothetical protein